MFNLLCKICKCKFFKWKYFKNIIDKIDNKEPLGIPSNVKRYFITHGEAVNLCLKSLLSKCDNKILVPKNNYLKNRYILKI